MLAVNLLCLIVVVLLVVAAGGAAAKAGLLLSTKERVSKILSSIAGTMFHR